MRSPFFGRWSAWLPALVVRREQIHIDGVVLMVCAAAGIVLSMALGIVSELRIS